MKYLLLLIPLAFSINGISAQCLPQAFAWQDGNAVEAMITNGGDLFYDGSAGLFYTDPFLNDTLVSSFFVSALWLGGYDPVGQLRLSATTYGRVEDRFEFLPGPYLEDTLEDNGCERINKIWKVRRADIEAHLSDFSDGIIDVPNPAIYAWPGRSNPHFYHFNDFLFPNDDRALAPFVDQNNDGIYNPDHGDYPHPDQVIPALHPEVITWTVFNDDTTTFFVPATPLEMEIHLTTWSIDCFAEPDLNYTIFTSYKLINKSGVALDDLRFGMWSDVDLGCYTDDYLGCDSTRNMYYAYNSDDLDGFFAESICYNIPSFRDELPALAVQFLNVNMDGFTVYYTPGGVPPNTSVIGPQLPMGYYNYLSGKWRDGKDMTFGGKGISGDTNHITNYIFSGNPNHPEEWSMYGINLPDGDRRAVGNHRIGRMQPEEAITVDLAFTHHPAYIWDHLEVVNQLFTRTDYIKQMYDLKFNSWCGNFTSTTELITEEVQIYPNPTTDQITIIFPKDSAFTVNLYAPSGQRLQQIDQIEHDHLQVSLADLPNGIYFLQLHSGKKQYLQKVMKQ